MLKNVLQYPTSVVVIFILIKILKIDFCSFFFFNLNF